MDFKKPMAAYVVFHRNKPKTKNDNYKCEQCGKEMNPIDYFTGSVCMECCRKNHKKVCGK